jgi:ribosomal protein S18 acetylase RimI-like enzyme
MIIRKAQKEDIEWIHNLDKENVKYHSRFDKNYFSISAKWWKIKKESQLIALKSRTNLILVVEHENEVVGYIWGYIQKIRNYKIGKIQELILTSKQRGKGVGKKLIISMLAFFKEKNCIISEIEVFVDNLSAIRAYEKTGFRKREYKMILSLDKSVKYRPFY